MRPHRHSLTLLLAGVLLAAPLSQHAVPAQTLAGPEEDEVGFTWWNDVPERVRRGNERYIQENFEDAERYYRDAQLDAPRDAVSSFNLGLSQARQDRLGDAIGSFNRSLSLARGDKGLEAGTHYNLGLTHLRRAIEFEQEQDRESAIDAALEALDSFDETLRLNPDDENARTNRQITQRFLEYFSIPPEEMPQQSDGQPGDDGETGDDQDQGQPQPQEDAQQDQQDGDPADDQQEMPLQPQPDDGDGSPDSDDQEQDAPDEDTGPEEEQSGESPSTPEPEDLTEDQARRLLNMLGDPENVNLRKGSRLTTPDPEKPW